jgi:hypothetical protein
VENIALNNRKPKIPYSTKWIILSVGNDIPTLGTESDGMEDKAKIPPM